MTHKAKVVKTEKVADGIIAVTARCCKDKSTDSVLSIHQLSRSNDAISADVQKHLARVESKHADALRAAELLEGILKVG